MREVLVLYVVALATVLANQTDDMFSVFVSQHGKAYRTDSEFHYRQRIFKDNVDYIARHNKMATSGAYAFTLGVNEYADMTAYEFRRTMNGYRAELDRRAPWSTRSIYRPKIKQQPVEVDWRTKGYVTAVKDQGQCGSCWAFSTTGSLEGQHFNATGNLVSLSEQNLVDCSSSYGNAGCNGGVMDNAFRYVMDYGIDTEASYPYTAKVGTCQYNRANIGSNCVGYHDVISGDENALKSASAEVGPVSVAIDASHRSFQLYRSGVYDEPQCSSIQLHHGVLVVGYGTEGDQDYWLVKNSWGEGWGQAGYVKMSRNRNNQCGIATNASFPIVTA